MKLLNNTSANAIRPLRGSVDDYSTRYKELSMYLQKDDLYTLFAEPQIYENNEIVWRTPLEGKVIKYNDLTPDQQSEVDQLLKQQASLVAQEMRGNSKLAGVINEYLTVPGNSDIFLVRTTTGDRIVLTQWGSEYDNSEIDASRIGTDEKLPFPVIFKVVFKDRTTASNQKVVISYKKPNGEKVNYEKITDNAGKIDFGKLRLDTAFEVLQDSESGPQVISSFRCDGRDEYIVELPILQNMRFKLMESNGTPKPNFNFTFEFGGQTKNLKSNENGIIELNGIKVFSKISAWQIKDGRKSDVHNFTCEENKSEYVIIISQAFQLPTDSDKSATKSQPTFSEPDILVDSDVSKVPISVRLIDNSNNTIPGITIAFVHNYKEQTKTTDNIGKCVLELVKPSDKDKIAANLKVGSKSYSNSIVYRTGVREYELKLKKAKKWLFLLPLLLLPLLLLIPLKKDVAFKVISSTDNAAVVHAGLSFSCDSIVTTDTTDSDGKVTFKGIGYSVHQLLFGDDNMDTKLFAADDCFILDTTINFFDLEDENIIYLRPITTQFEFTVVDADDANDPLVNVLVRLKSDLSKSVDTARTDAAGKVVFSNVPLCSELTVITNEYGYFVDSLAGAVQDILHVKDTIYLRQEKTPVKVMVKDLYTKAALSDIWCYLFLKKSNSDPDPSDYIKKVRTNINGKAKIMPGQGVFPDVQISSYIRIFANNKKFGSKANSYNVFYNDSTLASYYEVNDWISIPDSDKQKTIFLRPNPNPTIFKNIDCDSRKPLPNVENIVTITKNDGSVVATETVISDSKGEFSITANAGDKITIVAKGKGVCPNEYEDNNSSIVKADFITLKNDNNKRLIPLCRVAAPQVTFRNVDSKTGAGIAGVENTILLDDGTSVVKISTVDGTFIVQNAYDCQIISIEADGTDVGYGTNDNKIDNKLFRTLMPPAPQTDRDIPLEKEVTPPPTGKCKAHFSGYIFGEDISGKGKIAFPFVDYNGSSIIGQGEYKKFGLKFRDAKRKSLDGIAIKANTRVIIYSKKKFTGTVLLDRRGPLLLYNKSFENDTKYNHLINAVFADPSLQTEFPTGAREWSATPMDSWTEGSVKIICD